MPLFARCCQQYPYDQVVLSLQGDEEVQENDRCGQYQQLHGSSRAVQPLQATMSTRWEQKAVANM